MYFDCFLSAAVSSSFLNRVVLQTASKLAGSSSVDVLKYSLGIHYYSPKVEMYRQLLRTHLAEIGTETVAGVCLCCLRVHALIGFLLVQTTAPWWLCSRVACRAAPTPWTSAASRVRSSAHSFIHSFPIHRWTHTQTQTGAFEEEAFDFDHQFPSGRADAGKPLAVLYADLASPLFPTTHAFLAQKV